MLGRATDETPQCVPPTIPYKKYALRSSNAFCAPVAGEARWNYSATVCMANQRKIKRKEGLLLPAILLFGVENEPILSLVKAQAPAPSMSRKYQIRKKVQHLRHHQVKVQDK